MMLNVINQLKINEVDNKDTGIIDQPVLTIKNHKLRELLVVLEFENKTITVNGILLKTAIENAINRCSYL